MAMAADYIDNNCEGETYLIRRKKSERSCTDVAHLCMFGIFFTLWIGIAVHAYSAGYQPFDFIPKFPDNFTSEMSIRLSQCRNVCASFFWLAVLFLGLYFMAVRFLTKYVVYATIFLKFVLLSVAIPLMLWLGIALEFIIPIFTIGIIFYALTLYTFKKVGCKTTCIIIQESCKAMACHPSSILIVMIYTALIELLTCFIATVIFGLLTIPKVRKSSLSEGITIDPPAYVFILLFAFASNSVWILTMIYNVGRTTLYGIFSTWYRTADKKMISRTITFDIIYTNLRYHFGSLTFGSTIFTIVTIIRIVYKNWIDLRDKFKTKKITIFCFLIVLANATSNAFMACVGYGTNYYRSIHDSFKLLMLNPLKFAATRVVTVWMIFFGAVIIPGLTIFFAVRFFMLNSIYYLHEVPSIALSIIALTSMQITSIFLLTFYDATTAILFCFLEDLTANPDENDYNEENCV